MLQATGTVLEVVSETINPPNGSPFESVTVRMLTGKSDVESIRMGREVRAVDYPREGDEVTFNVMVSAFVYKAGGAGTRFTAVERVKGDAGAKPGPTPVRAAG